MEQNYVDFKYFILFILFLSIAKVHLQDSSEKSEYIWIRRLLLMPARYMIFI